MNMTVLTPIILFAASVAAMGCAYSALPSQRWWSRPWRPFPAHATASLAAMVALRGWIDVLGAFHGGLAWLSTLGVPLAVLFFAAATPRFSLRSLWVRLPTSAGGPGAASTPLRVAPLRLLQSNTSGDRPALTKWESRGEAGPTITIF